MKLKEKLIIIREAMTNLTTVLMLVKSKKTWKTQCLNLDLCHFFVGGGDGLGK